MNNLKKVVIPIAGLGTRMLPATKAIPKEMLPIVDKPIIQYIVEEALKSGFSEVIFITHSSKASVENHFDTSFELETTLKNRVKKALLNKIKNLSKLNLVIHSIRQGEPKGLGHAVLSAKSIIGKDPFGVMLPDMIFDEPAEDLSFAKMKENFENTNHSSLLVAKTKKNELHKYGVVKISQTKSVMEHKIIENVIEKSKTKADSRFEK